jgi:peptidoglycan/xylan/chitin deacetylase (PgdA/CDA1 family)
VPAEQRDLANESFFEYGSRAGYWRLLRVLDEHQVKGTIFGCAVAFERNPEAARAATARGWDICAHGNRWEEHWLMEREAERAAIARAVASITETAGQAPLGWYCRYGPSVNTRALVVAQKSFLYDSDSYADDLPYYVRARPGPGWSFRTPSTSTTSASGGAAAGGRRLLRVSARLRPALGGRRHAASHDVGRPALPHRGPSRGTQARALPRHAQWGQVVATRGARGTGARIILRSVLDSRRCGSVR